MPGKYILIVDDEPELVDVLSKRLLSNGYQVDTAYDGAEGLEKVKARKPDLIILDILMPEVDGMQMGEILKEDEETKDIPIIFLTALVNKEEAENIDHMIGHNYFLAKPFDNRELTALLKQVLNGS